MPYVPLRRGAGRLFDENLNTMLEELFLMLNTVDSTNSSTTPIAGAGTFTGEWLDVSGYNSTMIAVATDADSQVSDRRDFDPPLVLSPTDVMWFEAETDTNNTIVEVEVDLIEVQQVAT